MCAEGPPVSHHGWMAAFLLELHPLVGLDRRVLTHSPLSAPAFQCTLVMSHLAPFSVLSLPAEWGQNRLPPLSVTDRLRSLLLT